ncbi:unnamed protein product [Peronospora farinosa]|uniref:Uncharacterized protein n=1 Tax=Peronospora farinosa TaxID=134698 RepID=A0AAV0T619_9STRA|nr:unnamed protein product [Peronospora farinosa]
MLYSSNLRRPPEHKKQPVACEAAAICGSVSSSCFIIFRPVNELHLIREGVYTLPPRRKRGTKLQTELDAIDELGGIELVEHMSSFKDAFVAISLYCSLSSVQLC